MTHIGGSHAAFRPAFTHSKNVLHSNCWSSSCSRSRVAQAARRHQRQQPICSAHTSSPDAPGRRDVLATTALLLSAWLAAPCKSEAAVTEISEEEIERNITGLSSVVPALTVKEYVSRIRGVRSRAFGELRDLIDKGKFTSISFSLSIDPFDTIQQCSFFLPWALLKQRAAVPAQECYDAYLEFKEDLKASELAFDKLTIAAGRNQVDEDKVLQGLDRLESSLDRILSTVPSDL